MEHHHRGDSFHLELGLVNKRVRWEEYLMRPCPGSTGVLEPESGYPAILGRSSGERDLKRLLNPWVHWIRGSGDPFLRAVVSPGVQSVAKLSRTGTRSFSHRLLHEL